MRVSKTALRIAIAALMFAASEAFAPIHSCKGLLTALAASSSSDNVATLVENLPDLEELKSAPFMKQVGYGADMTEALGASTEIRDELAETLRSSLSAQLSHSDGIRGFMVSYLTGSYDTKEDGGIDAAAMIANEQDPPILLETVSGLLSDDSGADDLVSLMCMNVVMPIAMITMHQDPALSEASRLTAARGIRLLGSVVNENLLENLKAISEAASETANQEDKLVKYWTDFFTKWGYEETQKKDIGAAVDELLAKQAEQS